MAANSRAQAFHFWLRTMTKDDRQDRSTDGNDRRVREDKPEIHLFHGFREVLRRKAMLTDQCQRIRCDVALCLENIDDYQYKGGDKTKEQHQEYYPHDHMHDLFLSRGFFILCHAATSPFLPM